MVKLLAVMVGFYLFFCIRRLLKFYGVNVNLPWVLIGDLVISVALACLCLDLWTTGAMVVLHLAALFLLTDLLALLVRGACGIRGCRRKAGQRECLGKVRAGRKGKDSGECGGTGGSSSEGGRNGRSNGEGRVVGRERDASQVRIFTFCKKAYRCGILPVAALAILFGYGFFNMSHIRQTAYRVTTEKAVGEYRVILLTDIHYGTIQDPDVLKGKITEINALNPDIIVLAGDIVEEGTSREKMQEAFQVLGGMESKYGIYYVYGNHDRQPYTENRTYTNAELEQAIEGCGICILRDEYVEIGDGLILAGREDAMIARYVIGHTVAPEEILQGADREKFIIMAAHEPVEAEENDKAGVDLMLCGHTHAGQLMPVGILSELTGILNYGEYQNGSCKVIVSSGVAGWGYPIRTEEHCEYVVIDIEGGS